MISMADKPNAESPSTNVGSVVVIGATNRLDAIDPALITHFCSVIALGVPDEHARVEILSVLIRDFRVESGLDLVKLARSTRGFVGADLRALADKAGRCAMSRFVADSRRLVKADDWLKAPLLPEEFGKMEITMADFEEAAKLVQPFFRREGGFSSIPNVTWEDVGGLRLLRQELDFEIVKRIKHPEDYEDFSHGKVLRDGD